MSECIMTGRPGHGPLVCPTCLELERRLRELEEVIDNCYDEVFVTDGFGICVLANKAAHRVCDVPENWLIGRYAGDLEKEGVFRPSASLAALREKRPVALIQTLKSGKEILATATPLFDENGEVFRVICTSKDLAELQFLFHELEESALLQLRRYQDELAELRKEKLQGLEMVASSPQMKNVFYLAVKASEVDCNTLITGESGVGKEVVARNIHKMSKRASGPFVKVNCAAIPETLLESELFGYAKGSFTGALKDGKPGRLEMANGGTLFLDEIGDMPLHLQVKLLDFIQDKEFVRIGSSFPHSIDARIIAATNKDLESLIRDGRFREDLYFRLNVLPIHIPPLRERKEDILPLVQYFLKKACSKYRIEKRLSPEVLKMLLDYSWPGNVRELENAVEQLIIIGEGPVVKPEHVPRPIRAAAETEHSKVVVFDLLPLKEAIRELETRLVTMALERYGNTYRAAEALGVNQSTVSRKAKALGHGRGKRKT